MGVTLFGRSKQLSTSQSAESMLSPRVGGRTYQGGSDILAIFMPNSLPRGKRLMSNTPSLGVHFVWFWMIYNASQSFFFFLIGLIISHTMFRGVSPQIKCLLKLFSPIRTNIQQLTGNWTHMDTNQLPETAIPRKLFGQCFQDSRLRLGSRLLNLVKLTHPQDLVLHQIFYYSPQMGMEILSNAPGMPPTPYPGT